MIQSCGIYHRSTEMEIGKKENLERLSSELKKKDWFMTFLDLEDISEQKSGHWKIIQTEKLGKENAGEYQ